MVRALGCLLPRLASAHELASKAARPMAQRVLQRSLAQPPTTRAEVVATARRLLRRTAFGMRFGPGSIAQAWRDNTSQAMTTPTTTTMSIWMCAG